MRIALFVLLVIGGLLGNYFKYPIFLNIDFLFGSMFAMLALQYFDWRRGALAAGLIGAYTIVLWNHPYAFVVITAEAAVVGLLMQRFKTGLVMADALYWALVGIPLSYALYHGVMGVPESSAVLAATKSAVNGIANALVARLIFSALALRSRDVQISSRDLTYNLLTLFALAPALTILVVASRADFEDMDKNIRTELLETSAQLSNRLDVWLQNRRTAITYVASLAVARPQPPMQAVLDQVRASDVNFLRVAIVNGQGISAMFSPEVDEMGKPNIGRNFSDRPFIPQLQQTLKPMLSEVVVARVGAAKPAVSVLVPVVVAGEYAGFVAGILSLKQVGEFFENNAQANTLNYTLLDKNGNVILSNRLGQKAMAPMARGAGTLVALDANVSQWVTALAPGTPIMERWKSSFYVTETAIGASAEWKLVLEQPVAPFQKLLFTRYSKAMSLLLAILLVTLVLAELVSRRSIRTLQNLSFLTREMPVQVTSGASIAWPTTVVTETRSLIDNFKVMAASLAVQFAEVQRSNVMLESRVAERTLALQSSLDEKQALLKEVHHRVKNNLQVIASLLRMEGRRAAQPATKVVLAEMRDRIHSMALLHESLYRSGTFASVDLGEYLGTVARQVFDAHTTNGDAVRLVVDVAALQVGMDQALPCGLLVNELISNCCKHAFPENGSGDVHLELRPATGSDAASGLWCLNLSDTGIGLPTDFEERRHRSLGMQLVGDLAGQMGADLQIAPNGGRGVVFSLQFQPAAPAPLVMPG